MPTGRFAHRNELAWCHTVKSRSISCRNAVLSRMIEVPAAIRKRVGNIEGIMIIKGNLKEKDSPTHPAPLPNHAPDASAATVQSTSSALEDRLTAFSGVANLVVILRPAILGGNSQSKAGCSKNRETHDAWNYNEDYFYNGVLHKIKDRRNAVIIVRAIRAILAVKQRRQTNEVPNDDGK